MPAPSQIHVVECQNQVFHYQEEVKRLEDEMKKMSESLQKLKKRNVELEGSLSQSDSPGKSQKGSQGLEEEIQALREELKLKEKYQQDHQKEREHWQAQRQQNERELMRVKETLKIAQGSCEERKAEIRKPLDGEIEELSKELLRRETLLTQKEDQIKILGQKQADLTQQCQDLSAQKNQVDKQYQALTQSSNGKAPDQIRKENLMKIKDEIVRILEKLNAQ